MNPRHIVRRLVRDPRGNFAIWAALAMLPLTLGAGMALDYGQLSNRRAELQNALDSASLAIAREGKTISDQEASEIARSYLAANFAVDHTGVAVQRSDEAVTVSARVREKLTFAGVIGYDTATVSAASTAAIAYTKYEIALVLDTTGSMRGGKLASLQNAVIGLVDTMSQQIAEDENLKFAVVPFANFVNVGPNHGPTFNEKGKRVKGSGADWLDLDGKADLPQLELKKGVSRFEVFHMLGQSWAGCVETRYVRNRRAKPYDVADIPPTKGDKASLFVPAFAIDEPDLGYANSYIASDVDPLDRSIVGDIRKLLKYGIDPAVVGLGRGDDDDDDDDDGDDDEDGDDEGGGSDDRSAGGDGGASQVPVNLSGGKGPNKECVTQPILPLTSEYGAIADMVEGLTANGTTNITEGVAWGARVLSPGVPFGEGRAAAPGVEKVMIVLTDGANVFGNNTTRLGSSYSSNGYLVDGRLGLATASAGKTTDLMNEKTLAACTHAKEDGMTIYTIRLEEPDRATGTLLRDCATSPGHFFDAPSRSQLDEVFQKIRENVVRLRISS